MGLVERLEFKVHTFVLSYYLILQTLRLNDNFVILSYRKLCEKLQTYMDTTMGPIAQSFSSMRVHVNFVGF